MIHLQRETKTMSKMMFNMYGLITRGDKAIRRAMPFTKTTFGLLAEILVSPQDATVSHVLVQKDELGLLFNLVQLLDKSFDNLNRWNFTLESLISIKPHGTEHYSATFNVFYEPNEFILTQRLVGGVVDLQDANQCVISRLVPLPIKGLFLERYHKRFALRTTAFVLKNLGEYTKQINPSGQIFLSNVPAINNVRNIEILNTSSRKELRQATADMYSVLKDSVFYQTITG